MEMISVGGYTVPADRYLASKDNPKIKLYQKLSSQKKERQRYGLFVLEGQRIVRDALDADAVSSLMFTEKAFGEYIGSGGEPESLRDWYIISDDLAVRISQTETPQGCFAVCRIPQSVPEFRDGGRYVVLYGLQDPGNMGTIIRTADAFGIDGVLLCDCCDLYNPKTVRSTMGSLFRSRISVIGDTEELFSTLSGAGVQTLAAVIDTDAVRITELESQCRQAVFIGNEGRGLPAEISQRCDLRVTIPMQGSINSLNAAMAAGIIMWEMKKH